MAHNPESDKYFVAGNDDEKSSDHEKGYSHHDDAARSPGSYDPIVDRYSDEDVARIIRKIDLRLIPLCGLMYCVSLLDRTNLSNAAIAG